MDGYILVATVNTLEEALKILQAKKASFIQRNGQTDGYELWKSKNNLTKTEGDINE